jgi:hypothetical protein
VDRENRVSGKSPEKIGKIWPKLVTTDSSEG